MFTLYSVLYSTRVGSHERGVDTAGVGTRKRKAAECASLTSAFLLRADSDPERPLGGTVTPPEVLGFRSKLCCTRSLQAAGPGPCPGPSSGFRDRTCVAGCHLPGHWHPLPPGPHASVLPCPCVLTADAPRCLSRQRPPQAQDTFAERERKHHDTGQHLSPRFFVGEEVCGSQGIRF